MTGRLEVATESWEAIDPNGGVHPDSGDLWGARVAYGHCILGRAAKAKAQKQSSEVHPDSDVFWWCEERTFERAKRETRQKLQDPFSGCCPPGSSRGGWAAA